MESPSTVQRAGDVQYGYLAKKWCNKQLPLQVLCSRAGHYIGTFDEETMSLSRESVEYFSTRADAVRALETGAWTQKMEP